MRTPLDTEKDDSITSLLSDDEARKWLKLGNKILNESENSSELSRAYFDSSARFPSTDSFEYIESWVAQGLELDKLSKEAAIAFFQSTPEFLENGKMVQIRQWASFAIQILDTGKARDKAAVSYFKSSSESHRFLSLILFKEWKETGLLIAKRSANLASLFFEIWPSEFNSLYRTEIKGILGLVARIVKKSPKMGLEFYQKSPEVLLKLNPNIREEVIKTALRLSSERPGRIMVSFYDITSSLAPFSYPVQEKVIKIEYAIGELSVEASLAYFKNLKYLLSEIPELFLNDWVQTGICLLKHQKNEGIEYFSICTRTSREELIKWKEAVILEDIQKPLTIFAKALAGSDIKIKSTQELEASKEFPGKNQKKRDDASIFLLPHIAEENSREANFRLYKVSTAHHTGCVEFGTYAPPYQLIRRMLKSFPQKELATDIFFLVEDGRIDYNLRQEYKGLAKDIDLALANIMKRREFPTGDPLLEALEILLRFSVGFLHEEDISPEMSSFYFFLKDTLAGFYEEAQHVWDSFLTSVAIYRTLLPLTKTVSYQSVNPLPFWDRPDLDDIPGSNIVVNLPDEITSADEENGSAEMLFSKEELQELLKNLKDPIKLKQLEDQVASDGLYLTDLEGFELEDLVNDPDPEAYEKTILESPLPAARSGGKGPFYYDEWDHLQGTYRRRWCCLREEIVTPLESDRFMEIYENYSDLIQKVKKQFQEIRPQIFEVLHRVDWGDEIDLTELIQGVVDRKLGDDPTEKIFSRKEKRIRRISTLILLDMSASTDEEIDECEGQDGKQHPMADDQGPSTLKESQKQKKIIDIEIESLVVMAEALNALDDEYGIYGFSGQGRDKVEFYTVKDFTEPYSEDMKNRICGISPKQSTRMGTAIRHATQKLRSVETDLRLMIVLSDGYPQDMDYGEDRGSNEYALNDTMMALSEAKKEGIRPFCLTVDQAGNDYLRKMCDPNSYLIINDINSLPEILPKVVESLMG